jgi:Uma2 family endonuclease
MVLHMGPALRRLSDHEFFEFCQLNRDWRFERTSDGDLLIMTPTGGETGRRSLELARQFSEWAVRDGSGLGFDSSTGFVLPNGATRSPDLAWISNPRWESLTNDEREEFPPLCPDFVVELRSRSDSLEALQAKMREYIGNGALLGWLIDPWSRMVYVHRPGEQVMYLENPSNISGEPLLPGFVLDLSRIW